MIDVPIIKSFLVLVLFVSSNIIASELKEAETVGAATYINGVCTKEVNRLNAEIGEQAEEVLYAAHALCMYNLYIQQFEALDQIIKSKKKEIYL